MNILITGGRGFMGKALVKRLQDANHQVFIFDLNEGNISNETALNIYLDKKIEHIFHLAARSYVPDSWKEPYDFYNVNVLGTLNALEFARKINCSITVISSYVYGVPLYNPIDEQHPLHAFNPYAQSKILAEQLCDFYSKNFGLRITILRPFNLYGPGQASHFLIPTIINMIVSDEYKTIDVLDDRPKRDYVFMDDLIEALMLILKGGKGVFNIGSGRSISVREMIEIAQKLTNTHKTIVSKNVERPNEVMDTIANIQKIKKEFGWEPQTSIESGLMKCIYAANLLY
jgi:nucleoside-diphosphate-sugar epimerase